LMRSVFHADQANSISNPRQPLFEPMCQLRTCASFAHCRSLLNSEDIRSHLPQARRCWKNRSVGHETCLQSMSWSHV